MQQSYEGTSSICEKGIKSSTSPDNVDDSLGNGYVIIFYSSSLHMEVCNLTAVLDEGT